MAMTTNSSMSVKPRFPEYDFRLWCIRGLIVVSFQPFTNQFETPLIASPDGRTRPPGRQINPGRLIEPWSGFPYPRSSLGQLRHWR
jgi:hypothetical protein